MAQRTYNSNWRILAVTWLLLWWPQLATAQDLSLLQDNPQPDRGVFGFETSGRRWGVAEEGLPGSWFNEPWSPNRFSFPAPRGSTALATPPRLPTFSSLGLESGWTPENRLPSAYSQAIDPAAFELNQSELSAGCGPLGGPDCNPRENGPRTAYRFGWWGVDLDGSPTKVGEFQDLTSSPFWDLDSTWSNGQRTLDYTISGLDNEANSARGYYYGGPQLAVKLEFERYLRRLDHEPPAGFDLNTGTPGATDKVVAEDLNVGQDYAIRVQQLDTRVQGRLSKNLKWRVDLWGMRKFGERQANGMAHCFDLGAGAGVQNLTCHVLSQRQIIDWTTTEITPGVEGKIGPAVVEYTRTMRAFGQNDQTVDRTYTAFDYSPAFGVAGSPFVYGWVPENMTQIDRLKVSSPLDEANSLYAHLYLGNTENQFRDTQRDFDGFDVRLTNDAVDNVIVTAYAKQDRQRNELPRTYLTSPPFGVVGTGSSTQYEPGSLWHPLDYTGSRLGLRGRWNSPDQRWLSVAGGYEYFEMARDFATYTTSQGTFAQEDTQNHIVHIGPQMHLSPQLDTFIRYNGRFVKNPLIGVSPSNGNFNSNQPEQVHRIELGGSWTPQPTFSTTVLFGVENSWHNSTYANFDEDSYPLIVTVWYAPTPRWSLTTGYAYLTNWIDQDVTIAFQNNPTETTPWNYDGYNHMFNVSGNYAWSSRTQLVGGVEWDRGNNVFSVPVSPAGANWSALPGFSQVNVETTRITAGLDHVLGPTSNLYFRYVHFDYDDRIALYTNGTADMFLTGLTLLR